MFESLSDKLSAKEENVVMHDLTPNPHEELRGPLSS
ncbi:MAG: hypothetical protein DDT27_00784 [Dehalococcoidia bacterium]|nr:hypothetical protein [Chloroflexota bacterium]MBT9160552.1 hypothetical protein [Chloroflexota bacterium]MBT9162238.1 hypothetical protein [Chloroflexota bacterium]